MDEMSLVMRRIVQFGAAQNQEVKRFICVRAAEVFKLKRLLQNSQECSEVKANRFCLEPVRADSCNFVDRCGKGYESSTK